MDKKLGDWTLGEVKAECEKHDGYCKGCLFCENELYDKYCLFDELPAVWNTEMEVSSAEKV